MGKPKDRVIERYREPEPKGVVHHPKLDVRCRSCGGWIVYESLNDKCYPCLLKERLVRQAVYDHA